MPPISLFRQGFSQRNKKLPRLFLFLNWAKKCFSQITDFCQSCLYSQKHWTEWCIIDWSIILMKTCYYTNITSGSRMAHPHIDGLVQDCNTVHLLLTHWCYCSLALSHRYMAVLTLVNKISEAINNGGRLCNWSVLGFFKCILHSWP